MSPERCIAFSDGVFAVAITLLVLNLHGPAPGEPFVALVREESVPLLLFVASFAIVAIKWLNHHSMFRHIRRVDNPLLLLNLVLLLGVTAVPFTTVLLAGYVGTPYAADAALVYAGLWTFNGIVWTLVWWYATARGCVDSQAPQHRARLLLYALGPLGYLAGGALAFVNVYAAIAVFVAVALLYAAPG